MIWVNWEAEYFSKWGWTANALNSPSRLGKNTVSRLERVCVG
jgi:hypothetical protein